MIKSLALVATAAMLLTGCGEVGESGSIASKRAEQRASDSHGHDHNHDHGHDHDHGEPIALGTTTTLGISYEVMQLGEPHDGEQAAEVVLQENSPKPAVLRAWVGNETAEGSVKAKAAAAGPAYEFHLELPPSMSPGAKLWVEMENEAGERAAAGFDLKQ